MENSIYVGYDSRHTLQYAVTVKTLAAHNHSLIPVKNLVLHHLIGEGLYNRPTSKKDGVLFDEISGAPMATEFAISRFLIPILEIRKGWSLFCDSDFLFRENPARLFEMADDKYAVMCVHHNYAPTETLKMDGQVQSQYNRKNWSSLMLINNAHPANKKLTPDLVNSTPGRDLHRFCWLDDSLIGSLPERWNWLEGHSNIDEAPSAIHFTRGTPDMPGYETVAYADEWNHWANKCRAGGLVS
jgi:hypothetical protein